MIYEQAIIHKLYRKLLALYPQTFKERLGDSMEQTFRDLWHEKRQTKKELFGFVLWTFIETIGGIIQEHILQMAQGDPMKNILTNLRTPALISLLLVLPFMVLELVNRRSFNEGFPFPLFIIMWLLPILFLLTGMPIVRNVSAGNNILANPISLVVRLVFLALLVWMWFGILIDQMPCFLGIPNCD